MQRGRHGETEEKKSPSRSRAAFIQQSFTGCFFFSFFSCRWPLELSSRAQRSQQMPALFIGLRIELFYWKWVSQDALGKCRQVCLWVWSGHRASKWVSCSRVHSCGEYPALLWVTLSMWLRYRFPWRWYACISLSYGLYSTSSYWSTW